jgi:hypothetical protein
MKVKMIRQPNSSLRYDITLRYSLNSFPKGKSHTRYVAGLMRRLKIKRSIYNNIGPTKQKGRMSIFINYITEKEMKRICKKAESIKDDGIFREVLVYEVR